MAPYRIIDITIIKKRCSFQRSNLKITLFYLTHPKTLDIITAEKQRIKIIQI